MFKEDYMKDNNQIQPDEDFLKELQETIQDEKQKMSQTTRKEITQRHRYSWIGWAVAACAVFVCVVGIMSYGIDLDFSNNSLKGDLKSVFYNKTENKKDNTEQFADNAIEVSAECEEQYQCVLRMLQQQDVVLYVTDNFMFSGSGMEYLHQNTGDSTELTKGDCSKLLADILAEKYILAETTENFGKLVYYIAELEDGSGVSFVIGDNKYIYIHEVWGLQSLAELYN